MVQIQLLTKENFNDHSLDGYVRTQQVREVYRRVEGVYVLVEQLIAEIAEAEPFDLQMVCPVQLPGKNA